MTAKAGSTTAVPELGNAPELRAFDPEVAEEPRQRRRLSMVRSLMAVALLGLTGLGGSHVAGWALPAGDGSDTGQWFAPYVDVTLTPLLDFQDPAINPNPYVVLAFVVASKADPCAPAWGGAYSLDEAAAQLDLDRRIARLRQRGGDVVVSFGGAANTELGAACSDPDKLVASYRSVIDRYQVTSIDLDLEGTSLDDTAGMARRATAMAALQQEARDDGRTLDVWLTLPVAINGLQGNGIAAVDAMLAAKVELSGANVMTMDYGSGRPPEISMLDGSLQAVDATAQQLVTAYAAAGVVLTSAQAYDKVGVTPMIGQNDTLLDRLTTADAQGLADGSRSRGVRRLSMWSLNRDDSCGGNLDHSIVYNACSGVDQVRFQFSAIFGSSKARPSTEPVPGADEVAIATTTAPVAAGRTPATVVPGSGPYADWRPRREYDTYAKVVWEGQVYQAKWWNVGSKPNSSLKNEWDSPWRMLGPVLADDVAAPVVELVTLPPGTYPEWSAGTVYFSGDLIMFDGVGYKAKWWTRGDDPSADVDNPWESAWAPLDVPPPLTE